MSPGESFAGENTCYDLYNKGRNEERYLNYLLNAGLRKINSTMPFHNIMDTTRSGQQGLRENWSDWCNVDGAANGPKPHAVTGNGNLDAFVWASGIGISDGTSDPSSGEYSADCAGPVNFKPMPKRGDFSLEYFRMMLGWCKGCLKKTGVRRLLRRCG
jgi:cellulose 1,4-beta-cellobiosidase